MYYFSTLNKFFLRYCVMQHQASLLTNTFSYKAKYISQRNYSYLIDEAIHEGLDGVY